MNLQKELIELSKTLANLLSSFWDKIRVEICSQTDQIL
jgi:hypothetical protein